MYTYHIQDLLVSVDIRIIRSPSGLSISTGCPTVRCPTLSCPTAAAALDTVCPREEGRQFGGNGPMVLPGSCCSHGELKVISDGERIRLEVETQIQTFVEMGDMWTDEEDLMVVSITWPLHQLVAMCNLPFGVSSGDMTFPQQTRLRKESFAKQNGRWKLKSPVRTCTVLISFNL